MCVTLVFYRLFDVSVVSRKLALYKCACNIQLICFPYLAISLVLLPRTRWIVRVHNNTVMRYYLIEIGLEIKYRNTYASWGGIIRVYIYIIYVRVCLYVYMGKISLTGGNKNATAVLLLLLLFLFFFFFFFYSSFYFFCFRY